jgi:hypothetical protein
VFRYRLVSPAGDELGSFAVAVPTWRAGDQFTTGDGRRFRILRIDAEDTAAKFVAVWTVEPVAA